MQGASTPQVDPQKVRKSLLTWAIVGVLVIVVSQVGFGTIWQEVIIRPLLNGLLFLYAYLGHSFVVAITALTLLLRLITMPLQIKSIRSTRATAALQPQIAELQKKYGNDKERLVTEQQKLYKEAGVSPFSGCLPTLVQMPIWIGLYQGINSVLADTPIELMSLGKNVYHAFPALVDIIPLQGMFLGMDLAKPDPTSIVLPVLVAGTTYLQNKMMTQPSGGRTAGVHEPEHAAHDAADVRVFRHAVPGRAGHLLRGLEHRRHGYPMAGGTVAGLQGCPCSRVASR